MDGWTMEWICPHQIHFLAHSCPVAFGGECRKEGNLTEKEKKMMGGTGLGGEGPGGEEIRFRGKKCAADGEIMEGPKEGIGFGGKMWTGGGTRRWKTKHSQWPIQKMPPFWRMCPLL
jgi:hypothetical protein